MSDAEVSNIDIINQVCTFAAPIGKAHGNHWEHVHFSDGAAFAQTDHGGMLALLDGIELNCSVSATLMQKALKAVSGPVKFRKSKNTLVVTGAHGQAELPVMVSGQAPTFHRPGKVKWAVTEALGDADRVTWACGEDVSRPGISSVHLTGEGLEATNGQLMARLSTADFKELLGHASTLVMPRMLKGIGQGPRWIARDERRFYVSEDEKGTRYRSCKLVESLFPDFSQIIPKGHPAATVTQSDLLEAVKRASVSSKLSVMKVHGSRLHFEASSAMANTLFDFMDSVELREIDKSYPKDPIGIHLPYLLSAVEAAGEGEMLLRMKDPTAPILLERGEFFSIICPYRV